MEIFGESVGALDAFFGYFDFLLEVDLAAMGFVGDADNVGTCGQEFGVFGEFVDGGEEDAAAGSIF